MQEVGGSVVLLISSSIEFNSHSEWKRAWKFVDNWWRITSKDGNKTHYCCKRNHVRVHSTKRPRNTAILKKETCNAKMLVSVHGNTVIARKSGSWDTHCHSLDLMDQLQTNSFIREYIKKESKRGYDHISIYRAFRKSWCKISHKC